MPEVNRTAIQRRVGAPADVAGLEETALPEPGEGELLVELVVAPINPAEVLMLQGAYGHRETVPPLPRPMGIEGVGRVVGGATDRVSEGSLVALAGTPAVLSDYRVIRADHALVLAPEVDAETMALSFVNTQSVLLMLHEWDEVAEGDWIIQNAGNSGYGRILDAVASRRGIRVVNVVRSAAAAAQIASAAGPVVVDDGGDLEEQVLAATGGVRPLVAVDALGGTATGRLAATLEAGGRVVTYGLMTGEDCVVDTRLVVFGGIRLEGFWMPRSMPRLDAATLSAIGAEALEIVRTDPITVPVEQRYGLADIGAAVEHAARGERSGKILVTR